MMNIETLLQAAQILESQQSIPPKKRLARGDRQTPETTTTTNNNSHVPTSVLSPTILNTSPTTTIPTTTLVSSTTSLLKNDHIDDYPQVDHNLNLHHHNHLVQQRLSLDHNDDDDDDDDDDDETNNQNVNRKIEISNRVQTCFRDREIHNRLEKHRRAHLKDCFDCLKAEVPCQRDRKITNLQVLNLAIKYIQTLTRKERQYEKEISLLTSRNVELQDRLNCIKNELNSEGNNVDTWLDTCTDIDYSTSTCTASEAEMYRTLDDDDDDNNDDDDELEPNSQLTKKSIDQFINSNNHEVKTNSYSIESKNLLNNRKTLTRQRPRPSKRKLQSYPTTNLLQTLSTSIPINNNNNNNNTSRSENLLDFNVARHLHLNEPCNLLTNISSRTNDTLSLTPIADIRYDIVEMFTKGTTSHLQQQQQQISPLPSIASLMNRHSSQQSPIVSPTKQTIGINTDPLTTSTTNILHQSVATS